MNPYKPRPLASAHDAMDRLIDQCGGPKEVAAFLSVRLGTVYGYTDPDVSRGAPFAHVCHLTEHHKAAAAVEHLAILAGGVFVPVPADDGTLPELGADLTMETAEMVGELIRCMSAKSDGGASITEVERARLKSMAHDVMRVVGGILSELGEGGQ
ncbi:hypothetical protein [Terrihabitans sp. B22-R8]|uniref:hypothetical protein n=1 Tax=Terrihabitans sp. B22-R8 TaxID=3425128 RepID=UPI00403D2DBB